MIEFKIDTNNNYTILQPVFDHLDEKMADSLQQKRTELIHEGQTNFIIDLQNCKTAEESVLQSLLNLHHSAYNENHSLVFANLQPEVRKELSSNEEYHDINIAPTLTEAIDIISMEALERDLMNEEDEE